MNQSFINFLASLISLSRRGLGAMTSKMALLFLLLAWLPACTPLKPYHTPPSDVSLEERQCIYDQFNLSWGYWKGPLIGSRRASATPGRFERYMRESGDAASAEEVKKAEAYRWSALVAGFGGVALAYFIPGTGPEPEPLSQFATRIGPYLLGGLCVEMVILEFGRRRHILPAIDSFNGYLKRDLGLDASVQTPR